MDIKRHLEKEVVSQPLYTASGNLILREGTRSRVLSRRGTLTGQGKIWENLTGESLNLRGPEPYRRGQHEYTRLGGKEKRLRTWDPVEDRFVNYTSTGRAFYNTRKIEVVVHIPALVRGARRNGREYDRLTWFPVANLGLGKNYAQTRPLGI